MGFIARTDDFGVTAFVRGLCLGEAAYGAMVKHFERVPVDLERLTALWCRAVVTLAGERLYRVKGRTVAVGDSTKNDKRGRRMPGVKRLHSGTRKSTEAEYMDGHHVHVAGLLAGRGESLICIPAVARLVEGIKRSPSDGRTVRDRMLGAHREMSLPEKSFIVLDRYYFSAPFVRSLLQDGHDVIVRVKSNAVVSAFAATPPGDAPKQRGRPRKYAPGTTPAVLLAREAPRFTMPCPWDDTTLTVSTFTGVWRALGREVRWVVAWHDGYKAPMIVLSTDTSLSAHEVLSSLYAPRFKIEVMFRAWKHDIGAFAYRFWTRAMPKLGASPGDTFLHRRSDEERRKILAKVASYDYFLQAAAIAQGVLQLLSLHKPDDVRHHHGAYIRTVRENTIPSKFVTRGAVRNDIAQFLQSSSAVTPPELFIRKLQSAYRENCTKLAA